MSGERHSFYKQIHKGIRALAHTVAEQAGRTDFREPGEVASLRGAVERAFAVFESHAAHETAFITPVLRVCAPTTAADSDADHRAQELRLRDLRAALALAAAAGERAPALGHAFVVGLSRFVGEMLVHMADEEERLMPALQAAFDDEALVGIHRALLAGLSPDEKAQAVACMLPALSAPERTELLAEIRAACAAPGARRLPPTPGKASAILPGAGRSRTASCASTRRGGFPPSVTTWSAASSCCAAGWSRSARRCGSSPPGAAASPWSRQESHVSSLLLERELDAEHHDGGVLVQLAESGGEDDVGRARGEVAVDLVAVELKTSSGVAQKLSARPKASCRFICSGSSASIEVGSGSKELRS